MHCPTSESCKTYGACINDGDYRCITGCEQLCKIDGFCTPDYSGGELLCVARWDDCRESEVCKKYGRCTAIDDYCIPTTNESCKASDECGLVGRCTVQNHECLPANHFDCSRSWACKFDRKCFKKYNRGVCVKAEDL